MWRRPMQIAVAVAILLWTVPWIAAAVAWNRRTDDYVRAEGDYYFKANGVGVPEPTPQQAEAYLAMSRSSGEERIKAANAETEAVLIGIAPAVLAMSLVGYRLWRRRKAGSERRAN